MQETIQALRRRLALLRKFLAETVNPDWQRLYLRQIDNMEAALEARLKVQLRPR